jgi:hypothetical protein
MIGLKRKDFIFSIRHGVGGMKSGEKKRVMNMEAFL